MTYDRRASECPPSSYDRRPETTKVAAGKPFAHFLRDAQVDFLKEVVRATGKVDGDGMPMEYKVEAGISTPMMTFEGYDPSDLSVNGWVALTVHENDVKVHMEMVHGMLGRKEDVLQAKTGVLTPDLVARKLVEFIFGAR